jgi:DNA-directed RNA polymerase sigma subunit (sigma70/sigma32)
MTVTVNKDDAIFYLEMAGLSKKIKIGDIKPYYKILDERGSSDCLRLIGVYLEMRMLLTEREQFVLNHLYGVNGERKTQKSIGEMLNIGHERVRQIAKKAEFKIGRALLKQIKETESYER